MLLMFSLALMSVIGALASSAPGVPLDEPVELVKPQVAAARVASCGFKTVRPRFDDELQQNVIEVSDVASASTEQLRCVALASLRSHYYVMFPGPVEQTYQSLYWRMSQEREKADARVWLEKRGLLSRLPAFDPQRSDNRTFARALERLCGPKAAGTLEPIGEMATFKAGTLGAVENSMHLEGKLDAETLSCLLNAAAASGYSIGFIGNEAFQGEP